MKSGLASLLRLLSAAILLTIVLVPLAPAYGNSIAAPIAGEALSAGWRQLNAAPLAPEAALSRTLDPVILTGSQLSLFGGVSLGDLFVYAYEGGTWSVVPFQFDEVNSSGTFVSFEDGLLDSNDRLVFMAADVGTDAAPNQWLDNADSRNYSRYEVRVTNPLASAEEGWVFVYRSSTLNPTFSPYVRWDNANNRTVASSYILGYTPESHVGIDSLELNGSGVDVLDRSKIRISGQCFTDGEWHNFTMKEDNEELISEFEPPDIQGPVRQGGGTLELQSWAYASLFENNSEFDASYQDPQCEDMNYTVFRLSEDWRNPSASGMAPMTYYNSNTPSGVPVNGVYDSISATPVAAWWEVSGARGSVVQVADITAGGATVNNYYLDLQDIDPEDTGDQQSFGDAGYRLDYPDGIITLSIANYVLPPNQGNVGGTYAQYYSHPLQASAAAYGYLVAPTLYAIDNSDGNGDYLVDWSDVTNATGYELQEDDNSGFSSPTARYSGSTSQFQITGQTGGTWYYRVRATNSGGSGAWSSTGSVGVVPAAPTLADISNPDGDGSYTVDWSDVSGATSYELQEDDNSGFSSPTTRYSGSTSQYQVTAQAGGTWYYRVRASNAVGNGPWSNVESASVASGAPVIGPISNPDGDGSYTVDWSDVSGATSYELQEDDNSGFSTPATRYSGSTSQYQITGQTGGTWYYRVRASNAGGTSPWSNVESVGVIPAAPILADISNPDGNGDYVVDWSDATGATGYRLEEDDNASFSSPTVRYSGSTSQYQVTGQAGGTWYYRVRASNASGSSPWSNVESVGVIPSSIVLSPISNPDGDGEYLVDWGDVSGATSYELQEDDNSEFTSPTLRYDGSSSQYQVIGQGTGRWYYRVRAINAGGTSAWSNIESVGVGPAAPVLADIDNPEGDGDYVVDWSSVTGATGYELQEDDNSSFSTPTTRYSGSTSQYQVTGQGTGLWYYRVRASNDGGNSPWSNVESVGVASDAPVLAPISNPDGNGDYLIDWSDLAGATGYQLQEDDNASFSSPTTRYSGSNTQYQVYGQGTGRWYYRVRASNAGGDSPWSNVESVSVLPPAPVLAAIDNADGNGDYLVNWGDVSGATGYELQEDDNAEFSSPTVRYSGSTSQYQVSGQGTGLWYYRVRSSGASGNSAWSNVETAGVVPAAPVLADIDNEDGNGDYLVNWSDVTGATSYELQEDDNSSFSSPITRYNGVTSQYQVSGQAGGTWYYRVRAKNAGGNSAWSNSRSVAVSSGSLGAPVLADIDNPEGDGEYLVDWSSVTGATGYRLEEDDDPYFGSPTTCYSGSASEYQVTSHAAGTWHYRVRASSAETTGPWSNSQSVSIIPPAPELLPIGSPTEGGNYLVDWNDAAGATSYDLQEDDNSSFSSPTTRYSGSTSQYQVMGQAGGTWYYRVRASNDGGNSAWSSTRSVSVAPAAPALAPISNPDDNGDYLVDWSDSAGATGYQLQEDDNASFSSPTTRYNGSNSQYQVYGQGTGQWYYRVRASNAGGNSPWSNVGAVSVLPPAPVLAAIDNADGNGDYLVNWGDVSGATGYRLEEDDNAEFSSPTQRYSGSTSQYQVSGQGTGLWYYRVQASSASGNSAWSNIRGAGVVPAAAVLASISNPDGNGYYLVDWSDVTGATSYELQEDNNSSFSSPVLYTSAASQYQVYGQESGLCYYRVRARNAGGDSPWSNTQSVGIVPAAPVLALISNSDGNGDYLVDWSSVTGATGYRLEEDDSLEFSSPTVRYSGSTSQYQVSGQGTGLWYYRVRASNAGGNSSWSNSEPVGVVPAAPALASINNSDRDGNYLVDWSDVAGATGYRLEEDDNSGFSSPTVRYSGSTSQYQVSGHESGLWYYRVRAGSAGGDSVWSNTGQASVAPAAPVLAAIDNSDGNGDYLVDWSNVTGATGYRLEEDDNQAFSSPTVRYSGPESRYQVSGQESGLWYYRVQASNAGGNSAWSNVEQAGVVVAAPQLAPIDNTDGNGDYLIDWGDVTGATSYELQEDDNASFSSPTVRYAGAATQYQVSGQATGRWYYRLRAGNAEGNSPWSNVESASVVPADPVLASIDNPNWSGDYLVDWNDVAGATGYELHEDDNSEFTSPAVRYSGTSSQYQVYGQATGQWYYRVRAISAGGQSPWSNVQQVGLAPADPILAAIDNADGDGDYLVEWGDVVGAASYELQEDDNPAFDSPTTSYTGADSQYQVSGHEGGLWYYRVRAGNASGSGPWSNTQTASVGAAAPVLNPIHNPEGIGEYLVDWTDVPGSVGYQLEEADDEEFSSPSVRYTGTNSEYRVTGQEFGLWHYRVRASNAYGNGQWSNWERVAVVPAAPDLLPISNPDGDGSYLIEWTTVPGATGYVLEEADNPDFDGAVTCYDGTATQFEVAGQPAGNWYYRVRGHNAVIDGRWSEIQSLFVLYRIYLPFGLQGSQPEP